MSHTSVGIIFGGANTEHEVSCSSAEGVLGSLDRERFAPVLLGVDKRGGWHRLDSIGGLATAGTGTLLPDLTGIDVVLPVLHGRFGEDGTVQGLLDLAGIPYVGNGVLASALAMDKLLCQNVLAAAGLPTIPTVAVTELDRSGAAAGADQLGYPVFVKPNRSGSSVGVSRVDTAEQLDAAIGLALSSDSTALIQPLIDATEVDLGVLQAADGSLSIGAPLRIRPSGGSTFFDYASKYTDGGHEFEVPAKLDSLAATRLEAFALAAFRALGCEGLARVDFFLDEAGTITLNEVNTMPGMTALSQYPTMWDVVGVDYRQLLNRLIDRALVARPARTA
ncbi:D-alanine--D-alanine ligase family protein [Parafrigoribacterium mesophilum]|uniref:D-alanine--D-alanine ligase family protein n=1 Tax=Parafrigoribacterium mesophilum TaxID=433646 RepID=UPI0031FBF9E1